MRPLNALEILPEALAWSTAHVHPFFLLGLFTLVLNLVGALIFKRISDQSRLESLKRQIMALVLKMRLKSRRIGDIMRLQWRILLMNIRYVGITLPPATVIIAVMVLCLYGFEAYFSYEPIRPGQLFSVVVKMSPDAKASPELDETTLPEGIALIEHDARLGRWVFRAVSKGAYEIAYTYDGVKFTKSVVVGRKMAKLNATNVHADWFTTYMYSTGEPHIPSTLTDVIEASVDYTPLRSSISLFGWRPEWISFFFIVAIVYLLISRKLFDIN